MAEIICVSKRTDIPACLSDWFMSKLRKGSVTVSNPFNKNQVREISLKPEDVTAIAFWTKNPKPMIPYLKEIIERGYKYYFQVAINRYGEDIEKNVPYWLDVLYSITQMKEINPESPIIWRYSPVMFFDHLDSKTNIAQLSDVFQLMCRTFKDYISICNVSILDEYPKIQNRLKKAGIRKPNQEEVIEIFDQFGRIGKENGIQIQSCTEGIFGDNIYKSGCINPDVIYQLTGKAYPNKKDKGQKPNCNCIKAVDIGSYNTCTNGCIYCYANK